MNTDAADNSFIADALPAFISEACDQIEALEQLLLQLEDAPADRDLLDALFRCAHTIKGSAGIFGLDEVVDFTHHVETLLDRLREGQVSLTPELGTLLLRSNDQIRLLVQAAEAGDREPAAGAPEREDIVARLLLACGGGGDAPRAEAQDGQAPTAVVMRRWQVSAAFGSETFRNGMDPLAILDYVHKLGTVADATCDQQAIPPIDVIDPEACHLAFTFTLASEAAQGQVESAFSFVRDDCTLSVDEVGEVPAAAAAPRPRPAIREAAAGAGAGDEHRFIRVQADRLDDVINLLGELVIAGAGASLLARQSRQKSLVEANRQVTGLIEEIRNGTLQLRMVPIGETFSRFRRVVRDTASELGKDVVLEIVGGETELDKAVVERIADPLMHLVRNALDHGLETPELRVAAGKPPQGKLTLSACHESGSILIRIADNGRGIQRDRVLQRAWERGLVEHGVVPADDDILKLIFEAGFSTAEKVTNLSGRGVGMDVVRRNIEDLRGSVAISSEAGQGSCIEIRLPLTLAIIDGFLVGVGTSKFILPLDAVVEVIESRSSSTTLDARGRTCVELRGQVLPVVSLRRLYALDSPQPERSSVVVVRSGMHRYGVMVDVLLGQHQTVIKPLGRMFRCLRGMSGSSILGTGEVALIFDVHSLAALSASEARSDTARDVAPPASPASAHLSS